MIEVIILFGLALIFILFATIQDLRTREIANWLNYSLVIFALGFRFFYSLFELGNFNFFYNGIIGFLVFLLLGNIFYYARMFAGGDAKLMMALGAILPIHYTLIENIQFILEFLLLFLVVGAIYGSILSVYFGIKNFSKLKIELLKEFKDKKKIIWLSLIFAIFFAIMGFYYFNFIYFAIFLFLFPYLYLFFKSVDSSAMIRKINVNKLSLGDWLSEDVRVGKKVVKATWDGLNEDDLKLLRKGKRYVFVRYGIQFAPVFLISFVLLWLNLEFGFLDFIFSFFLN